jgi:hypothetical protein
MQRAVFIVFLILAICGGVGADQGRTEIGPTDTFPIVIDEPGSYVLTADLHVTTFPVNGIEIAADNVTLDLGGHILSGIGTGFGIFSDDQANVAIQNGVVKGFSVGINLRSSVEVSSFSRLLDLAVSDCDNGGVFFHGGTAQNIVVHDNGGATHYGEGLSCSNCSVSNVVSYFNFAGVRVTDGSVYNCTASNNSGTGIVLRRAVLNGGTSSSNGGHGIHLMETSAVVGVSVSGNALNGILLDTDSGSNVVNCTGGNNAGGNITGCADGNGCHQNYLP